MKLRLLLPSILVLACGTLAARAALQESMMPAKPGPEHEILKQMAGTFDAVVHAGPTPEKGTMTTRLLGNGLWAVSDFEGAMMGGGFVGHDVFGYDVAKKKYVSNWVDTLATSMFAFEGTWDAATQTMTMETTEPHPDTGEKMINVTKVVDADHHVFEMHFGSVDSPAVLKIEYTRRK
jgi:hypothetical protein